MSLVESHMDAATSIFLETVSTTSSHDLTYPIGSRGKYNAMHSALEYVALMSMRSGQSAMYDITCDITITAILPSERLALKRKLMSE